MALAVHVITVYGVSLGQISAMLAALFSLIASIVSYINHRKIQEAKAVARTAKIAADITNRKVDEIDVKVDGNLSRLIEALRNSVPVDIVRKEESSDEAIIP